MIIYFNATPHTDFGLHLLKGKSINALPDIETELRSVPAKNGAYRGQSRLKERYFKIPFAVQGANETEVHQKIEEVKRLFVTSLGQPKELQMRFSWQSDRFYKVSLVGASPYLLESDYAEVEFEFVAADPYAYGVTPIQFTHSINIGQPESHGFATLAAYLPYMRFVCTDMNAARDFEMTLTSRETVGGPVTGQSKILLKNTTRFTIGDVIEIDYERQRVLLNGKDAMHLIDWYATKFSEHTRGMSVIQFQVHWNATISYTPKYI